MSEQDPRWHKATSISLLPPDRSVGGGDEKVAVDAVAIEGPWLITKQSERHLAYPAWRVTQVDLGDWPV